MYDYGFRIYDPRIGRFLSVDPLTKSYPMLTPYQFAANMPTWAADLDGLEAIIHNQNDNSITIIGNIYIVSEGKGKLNSTKIKTMTEERIVNQLSDIESTIGGSQIKIKLNYITEDKDGNPLTYSSAVESAKNSVVTYTSSDGEKTDIAGWQTGVVVSTDEVGGSAFPDFQPGLMTPGSTNKAEGRGEFNSIRINRNLVQKMNGSGGAEAAAHEIAHFLGRRGLGGEPNNTQKYDHAGGVGGTDPGATSNKDENVRLVPSDLAPMVRGANKEGIRVTIPKK